MRILRSFVAGAVCAIAAALTSAPASAHIELIEPAPRYEVPANKSCPCGDGDSNRVCQVSAEQSTDPNRSANVTTFEAGSTITIRADEYIDHSGRMRVAFDPDGADLADFNSNILLDVPDPSDSSISQATPLGWELEVTLPNTPCESCTLQVIQVMNGITDVAVTDPAPLSTYYTCADIRIVAAGTLPATPDAGGGTSGGAGGSANAGAAAAGGSAAAAEGGAAGATSGMPSSSAGRGGAGGAAAGGAGPTGAPSVDAADDGEADDGGCAIQPGRSSASAAWLLVGLAGAGLALQRRRRRP